MKKNKKLSLPAMAVGILFLVAGLMKLFFMTPAGFSRMLQQALGFGPQLAMIAAWLVSIIETLGGIAILIRKCLPCSKIYKVFFGALIVIIIVAIIFINLGSRPVDIMGLLNNLVILSVLVSLFGCCNRACSTSGTCDSKE